MKNIFSFLSAIFFEISCFFDNLSIKFEKDDDEIGEIVVKELKFLTPIKSKSFDEFAEQVKKINIEIMQATGIDPKILRGEK